MSGKIETIQSNGQRIYRPFPSSSAPPRGSEIFVGNLPRDLYEEELVSMFSEVGRIYKLRLMMDFSGFTRGFAFVCYFTVEDARKAVMIFDRQHVSSKTRSACISVNISLDNCRLFFGNIPRYKTSEEIKTDLKKVVSGVTNVIVYAEVTNASRNRGFAFVEFEQHAMAAIARRKLAAGFTTIWGRNNRVYVDWAEPEPIIDPSVLTQVKILYFKNVPVQWSTKDFKEFTQTYLTEVQIERIYKRDNYAFVHFYTRDEAERAFEILKTILQLMEFSPKPMEVEWARPVSYSKRYQQNQPPDNFCISVPPKRRRLVQKSKRDRFRFSRDPISSSSSSSSDGSGFNEIASTQDLLASQFEKLALYSHF